MKTKLKKWKKVRSEVVYKNTYFTLYHDEVRLPTGELYHYYVTNKQGRAALVLPIDSKGRITILKEFRYPTKKVVYGLVGGSVDPGETPLKTARRELKEETGFSARSIKLLGSFFANPSRSGATFYVYIARGLTQGEPCHEHGEFLECEALTPATLRRKVKRGEIVDPFLLAALQLLSAKEKL